MAFKQCLLSLIAVSRHALDGLQVSFGSVCSPIRRSFDHEIPRPQEVFPGVPELLPELVWRRQTRQCHFGAMEAERFAVIGQDGATVQRRVRQDAPGSGRFLAEGASVAARGVVANPVPAQVAIPGERLGQKFVRGVVNPVGEAFWRYADADKVAVAQACL